MFFEEGFPLVKDDEALKTHGSFPTHGQSRGQSGSELETHTIGHLPLSEDGTREVDIALVLVIL